MQTLYAHMSGNAVSVGTYVSAGQTIGYLGQTGRATGVHCHLEIFVNGSRVDPASYFSGMTYYNC
jgi:murein DD-endopeptidase MepM/ murein hydrolase activator NlpD